MDENIKNTFNNSLSSNLHIKRDYASKVVNTTWLEQFEDVIPYIDNILRNPKKFIVNEEDIVKIEKAKKVTVESVIHLTQHTNFIEDFNAETGEVRPAKILNINKEESLDTYENRFVHTLIKNMRIFYDRHIDAIKDGSYLVDSKEAYYEGNTKVGNEDVKIKIKYSSLNKSNSEGEDNGQSNLQSRLKNIKVRLDGFACSELMATLDKLHVPDVMSPIRKTNAILKNPNFQKATQLWNYIQSYEEEDSKEEKNNSDYEDNGQIKEQFNQSFLLDYIALTTNNTINNNISEKQLISYSLSKVIENILDLNDKILESKIRSVFKEEFIEAKNNYNEKNKKIIKILNNKLSKENNRIQQICKSITMED